MNRPSRKRDVRQARHAKRRQWTPEAGAAAFMRTMQATAAAHSTAPLDADSLLLLSIKAHGSLEAIQKGRGTDPDAETLVNVVNLSIAFAEAGLGSEWGDVIEAARIALLDMGARAATLGRFVLRGPQIPQLDALLELFDAQLRDPAMTEGALVAATAVVRRRIAAGEVDNPDTCLRSLASAAQATA